MWAVNFKYLTEIYLVDGFVFLECKEPVTRKPTGQVILDYLTDAVVSTSATLLGKPYISPDSRKLVTFNRTPSGATLIVQEIKGKFKIL